MNGILAVGSGALLGIVSFIMFGVSNLHDDRIRELIQMSQSSANLVGSQAAIRCNLHHFEAVNNPNGYRRCSPNLPINVGQLLCHFGLSLIQVKCELQGKLSKMLPLLNLGCSVGDEQSSQITKRTTSEREQTSNVGITHENLQCFVVGFCCLFGMAVGFGIGYWLTMPNEKAEPPWN